MWIKLYWYCNDELLQLHAVENVTLPADADPWFYREGRRAELGKHGPRNLASCRGLLTSFQDYVLPVASNVCDDLHVCYGCSAHKDHLKDEAVAGTQIFYSPLILFHGNSLWSWCFLDQVSPTKQACSMWNWKTAACTEAWWLLFYWSVRPEWLPGLIIWKSLYFRIFRKFEATISHN